MILTGILLLALALFGAPLFAVIAAGAILAFGRADIDQIAVVMEIYRIADTPVLLAIPLFTFAGFVLSESRAPSRLVRVSDALLGWMPGGLAVIALVICALFTAFTGASGVTIVAMGALLYPALRDAGYRENFSLGLVTTSGSLGLLFAPSLPLILYGIVAEVSIDRLFIAGPRDVLTEGPKAMLQDALILKQEAALAGQSGAVLWAVSAENGEKLGEYKLDAPPVFDGMAVANECLFLTTVNGKLLCLR